MPRTKIDGFFEEFFWLSKRIPSRDSFGQFYVSKIEPRILEWQRLVRNVSYRFFSEKSTMTEWIQLLDENGEVVIFVERGETVGDAIRRTSAFHARRIVFILSSFTYTDAVIIYKSPAGISVPKWIDELVAREKAKIHAEVEAIDAEYEPPKPPEGPPNRVAKPGEYGFESFGHFSEYE